jgi:hypothetical protein
MPGKGCGFAGDVSTELILLGGKGRCARVSVRVSVCVSGSQHFPRH